MTSPVAHEHISGKELVGSTESRKRTLPTLSPALPGSVMSPVTLAVPKELLLSSRPAMLGRKSTRYLERLSWIS